jgi:hypothetical protein
MTRETKSFNEISDEWILMKFNRKMILEFEGCNFCART